jgi:hypothetical protein
MVDPDAGYIVQNRIAWPQKRFADKAQHFLLELESLTVFGSPREGLDKTHEFPASRSTPACIRTRGCRDHTDNPLTAHAACGGVVGSRRRAGDPDHFADLRSAEHRIHNRALSRFALELACRSGLFVGCCGWGDHHCAGRRRTNDSAPPGGQKRTSGRFERSRRSATAIDTTLINPAPRGCRALIQQRVDVLGVRPLMWRATRHARAQSELGIDNPRYRACAEHRSVRRR